MTWILFGTSSLRMIDSSELGERFLDCIIMEDIDDELEDAVLVRVANQESKGLSGKCEEDRNFVRAKQLTGGYINYLRDNAVKLVGQVGISDEMKVRVARLGKFVAYMRAKPPEKNSKIVEREFGARLVRQHVRLAVCLAAVMGKKEVDGEVINRVRKISLDTGKGPICDVATALYDNPEGMSVEPLAFAVGSTSPEVSKLLRFMRRIKAVSRYSPPKKKDGVREADKYVLTDVVKELYRTVVDA